jgi:hypothetical protein
MTAGLLRGHTKPITTHTISEQGPLNHQGLGFDGFIFFFIAVV